MRRFTLKIEKGNKLMFSAVKSKAIPATGLGGS
jgi:hypothetical protein